MFKVLNPFHTDKAYCSQPVHVDIITEDNVQYFDKDGFELTALEKEYYKANSFDQYFTNCLNHTLWQEPWIQLDRSCNFILDHSIILHRCSFTDEALDQLKGKVKDIPRLAYLIQTPSKWGVDFSLDYVDEKCKLTEVIHIEIDTKHYHEFLQIKEEFENFVLTTDWEHVYMYLDQHRNEWERLVGFEQNDWKARHLGFKKAEITLKAI